MDFLQAVILGVVEGVTEYLPVSSTGHMIIAAHLLRIPETDFVKTFEIAIQMGAIAAVFSLYWRTFLLDWEVGAKVLAAFVPTAMIGLALYHVVKHVLLGNVLVVIIALLAGGALMIAIELLLKGRQYKVTALQQITYAQAVTIGICQALAVVPGVSRSAATILAGLMLGVGRQAIVEFSFLLAVPTISAATLLDILKSSGDIRGGQWGLLAAGFVAAMMVAWASVRFLLKFIKRHDFISFGIYRIIFALVLLFLFCKSSIITP